MNYTTLNHTDIRVSTLMLGCFAFAGGQTWGDQDEQDSVQTLEMALENGINFFDTAEGYGEGYTESLLGRVFARRRHQVVLASKVSPNHLKPDELEAACVASLRRLKTDYLDLYQIHWPNHEVPLADTVGKLEELRARGMIRAIGVSNFGVADLRAYLELSTPVTNQLPYSLLWRAIEDEIIPLAQAHDVGVLPYSPLMQGLLTGKFRSADEVPEGRARTRHFAGTRPQAGHGEAGAEAETFRTIAALSAYAEQLGYPLTHIALAWVLQQPSVPCVLVGARSVEQLMTNIQAAEVTLPPGDLDMLSRTSSALKEQLGLNPDMWNAGAAARYR